MMDLDLAPLQVNSYLKQISEITIQAEEKHNKITKGEKKKHELEQQVKQLQNAKYGLEDQREKSILLVSKLKTDIFNLQEESKSLSQLENKYKTSKNNEDAKLWDLSQKVYSEIIGYCDKVQEFVENYNLPDMINEIINPISNDVSQNIDTEKIEKVQELKRIKDKLTNELNDLNSVHIHAKEVLEKKYILKRWPLEGKEFLELQAAITRNKEISKQLYQDIFEIEEKRKKTFCLKKDKIPLSSTVHDSKPRNEITEHENNSNATAVNYNSLSFVVDKQDKINKTVTPCEKQKQSTINFVPKTKRFKPFNIS